MISKTEQAKTLFIDNKIKKSLKIFKGFDRVFTKDELKILGRTYEMFSNLRFYESLGFNFNDQLEKSMSIIRTKYNI